MAAYKYSPDMATVGDIVKLTCNDVLMTVIAVHNGGTVTCAWHNDLKMPLEQDYPIQALMRQVPT